jgi:2'-5' RNA ligase
MLQAGVPGARWVAPENMHITLRFIGEVDEGHASDIDAALHAIHAPAFEVAVTGVGHFGDGSRLRALYAAVERTPALNFLQDKVESAVVRAGCRPEGRRFVPHITLARFGGRDKAGHHLAQFMAGNALMRCEPFAVDRFTLFSSVTRPDGPIYRAEADYPLQG